MTAIDIELTSIAAALRAAGCVFADDEAALLASAASTPAQLTAMVERRAAGLPLEQVLGWAQLCGVRVAVEPGVFVPRRRTELLAREALRLSRPGAVVVELCCGVAAVAAVVAAHDPVELYAVDVDPAAVRCARRNLASARAQVFEGDLYTPLPPAVRRRVDVVVANAPYVPTAEIDLLPAEAREHEPRIALDGGGDGLDIARRVVTGAPGWLAPGGHVLVETSERQAPALADAVTRAGLTARVVGCDDLAATVVIGAA